MADPVVFENAYVAVSTSTASAVYVELPGVKSITMPFTRAELDDSVMGDTIEAKFPGVLSVAVSVTMRQDFSTTIAATSGADKLIYLRLINRTAVRLKVRPVDAAVSGPNPSYIFGKMRFFTSSPLDGKWGDALEQKVDIKASSACTLTRSTST